MSEPDPGFETLLEFVRDERGFDYSGYRRPTLMRRFEKRMQEVGADDWDTYRAYLPEHPEEYVELFNTILINVTGFFRDRETWELVATEVIPRLLDERAADASLRVWSAGCASGEEPYTIAMLLSEALGEEAFKRRVKIYATDIDEEALTQARDAAFSSKQLEGVPAELKRRVFMKDGATETDFRLPRLPAFEPERAGLPHLGEAAFEHAPTAQVVLDEQNRVAGINQAARTLFSLRHRDVGRALQDLELSYRPVELRSMIDQVRKDRHTVVEGNVRWQKGNDDPRSLDVQVDPLALSGEQVAGVIVSYLDWTEHRVLEEDLQHARRELETAYEELQSTVEELETMNDELRERTDETLQANSFLGSVLSGIRQGVVAVDRTLRVVAWSRRTTDLWGLRDDEVEGEHLLNLDIGIPVQRLRDPIRQVLTGAKVDDLELEGHDRRGTPVRVRIAFAQLQNRPDAEEPDGAILLLSAQRAD